MGVKRFHFLCGGVSVAIAGIVATAHGGTVPVSPELPAVEAPLDFEQSEPLSGSDAAKIVLSDSEFPVAMSGTEAVGIWSTVQPAGEHSELLLLGDTQPPEPINWSPGFAGESTGSSSPARSAPAGLAFAPVPDQVLIPIPSAAWTGLTGLAGLGLLGVMKHVRRFFR